MATRSAILWVLLLAIFLGRATVAAEPADDRILDLCYLSAAKLTEAEVDSMKTEVKRIFATTGFQVRTHDEEELSGAVPAVALLLRQVLRVVILDVEPSSWGLASNALGATIGKRRPPNAVYVFWPVLRRVLDLEGQRRTYLTPDEVGGALARVITHEIVHAYVSDHPHSGWGIMGHNQDAVSLTQMGGDLNGKTARAFVEGWERAMAAGAGATAGEGP